MTLYERLVNVLYVIYVHIWSECEPLLYDRQHLVERLVSLTVLQWYKVVC